MKKSRSKDRLQFKVDYAVLCESVSKEVTGKDVLVGAVPNGLMSHSFPVKIRCAFWCVISAYDAESGSHNIQLRVHPKDDLETKIAQFEIQFSIPKRANGRNAFATAPAEILINEPMIAALSWSIDGSELTHLQDIPFQRMKTAQAS